MALSKLGFNCNLSWLLTKVNQYGTFTTDGPDSLNFNLGSPDVSTWDQLFASTYTIAAAGTQAIDLSSFTNAVCEATGFLHVLAMEVKSKGGSITISQGASNGFNFNFQGTSPTWTVNDGGVFAFSEASTGGLVVDGTHKNILLTNNSITTSTVSIVIAGSTS